MNTTQEELLRIALEEERLRKQKHLIAGIVFAPFLAFGLFVFWIIITAS